MSDVMSTVITFHLISMPDPPISPNPVGTVMLDVTNTYTMTDADAAMMVNAFVAQFTQPNRPGRQGGPSTTPPTPDQAVTMACAQLWNQLQGRVQAYFAQQAQIAAQAAIPAVAPPQVKTTVAAAWPASTPLP